MAIPVRFLWTSSASAVLWVRPCSCCSCFFPGTLELHSYRERKGPHSTRELIAIQFYRIRCSCLKKILGRFRMMSLSIVKAIIEQYWSFTLIVDVHGSSLLEVTLIKVIRVCSLQCMYSMEYKHSRFREDLNLDKCASAHSHNAPTLTTPYTKKVPRNFSIPHYWHSSRKF